MVIKVRSIVNKKPIKLPDSVYWRYKKQKSASMDDFGGDKNGEVKQIKPPITQADKKKRMV